MGVAVGRTMHLPSRLLKTVWKTVIVTDAQSVNVAPACPPLPWYPPWPESEEVGAGAEAVATDDATGEFDAVGKVPEPVVDAATGTTAAVEAEMMLWPPEASVVMLNSVEVPEIALAAAVAAAPETLEKAMVWPVTAVGLVMSAISEEMPAVSRDWPWTKLLAVT